MPRMIRTARNAIRSSGVGALALAAALSLAACISAPPPDAAAQHGITFSWDGVAHRTVKAPLASARSAAIAAVAVYSMRVEAIGVTPGGETIKARALDQNVLIELERQGRSQTRLRVTAERTLATNLLVETLRVLGPGS